MFHWGCMLDAYLFSLNMILNFLLPICSEVG